MSIISKLVSLPLYICSNSRPMLPTQPITTQSPLARHKALLLSKGYSCTTIRKGDQTVFICHATPSVQTPKAPAMFSPRINAATACALFILLGSLVAWLLFVLAR